MWPGVADVRVGPLAGTDRRLNLTSLISVGIGMIPTYDHIQPGSASGYGGSEVNLRSPQHLPRRARIEFRLVDCRRRSRRRWRCCRRISRLGFRRHLYCTLPVCFFPLFPAMLPCVKWPYKPVLNSMPSRLLSS
jgi:hypothetical protein